MIDSDSPVEEWELLGPEEPEPAEDEGYDPFKEEDEDNDPPGFDVEKYNFRQPTHPSRPFQGIRAVRANQKKKVFLRVLAQTCCVVKAATAAGYSNSVPMYRMRKEDPEFAKAWDEAAQSGADILEKEAVRRAVEGTMEEIYWKGEVVGEKINYSDALLIRLLKAHKPDKFADNTKVQGEINVNHGVVILPGKITDTEEWERQVALRNEQRQIIDITPDREEGEDT